MEGTQTLTAVLRKKSYFITGGASKGFLIFALIFANLIGEISICAMVQEPCIPGASPVGGPLPEGPWPLQEAVPPGAAHLPK